MGQNWRSCSFHVQAEFLDAGRVGRRHKAQPRRPISSARLRERSHAKPAQVSLHALLVTVPMLKATERR